MGPVVGNAGNWVVTRACYDRHVWSRRIDIAAVLLHGVSGEYRLKARQVVVRPSPNTVNALSTQEASCKRYFIRCFFLPYIDEISSATVCRANTFSAVRTD